MYVGNFHSSNETMDLTIFFEFFQKKNMLTPMNTNDFVPSLHYASIVPITDNIRHQANDGS